MRWNIPLRVFSWWALCLGGGEVGRWGGGRKKIENGWRATRRLRLSRSAAGAFAEGGRVRGGFSHSGRFGEDALGAGQN